MAGALKGTPPGSTFRPVAVQPAAQGLWRSASLLLCRGSSAPVARARVSRPRTPAKIPAAPPPPWLAGGAIMCSSRPLSADHVPGQQHQPETPAIMLATLRVGCVLPAAERRSSNPARAPGIALSVRPGVPGSRPPCSRNGQEWAAATRRAAAVGGRGAACRRLTCMSLPSPDRCGPPRAKGIEGLRCWSMLCPWLPVCRHRWRHPHAAPHPCCGSCRPPLRAGGPPTHAWR